MRAPFPPADIALVAAQLEAAPGTARVRALRRSFGEASPDTVRAILEEASRFATEHLSSLNDSMDADGCRTHAGRVMTAPGHRTVWSAFVEAGWSLLDGAEEFGGQALPAIVAAAVQEQFDRACPAFGMLPVPQRSAARLIAAYGDTALQREWLPRLASGEWGATICISEAEAGSDAGRIRTRAMPNGDGSWAITGEKCWISFGDHDLTARIGHCLLARTPDAAPGGAGLSLFLVPDTLLSADSSITRNAVTVRRIEHKMGLHGSPTCALGFEGATGWMLGVEGRGLAQMFVMITHMRLAVGTMGLGIAGACADLALAYAEDRRQGGAGAVPVAIAEHADVQRQLLDMSAHVDVLRGLIFAVANLSDIAAHAPDPVERGEAQDLAQWLLPIVKTLGGDTAFDVASGALQVLGGAGYTCEWPVEQAVRDARVLPVFEGTTGIQALDLIHRRLLRGDARGYVLFLSRACAAVARCAPAQANRLAACLDSLERAAHWMRAHDDRERDAGATAFLHLASLAASGWIAAGMTIAEGDDPASRRLRASGRYRLAGIAAAAAKLEADATTGASSLADFGDIRHRSPEGVVC